MGLWFLDVFLIEEKSRYLPPPPPRLEQSIMVLCSLKGKNTRLDYKYYPTVTKWGQHERKV